MEYRDGRGGCFPSSDEINSAYSDDHDEYCTNRMEMGQESDNAESECNADDRCKYSAEVVADIRYNSGEA